MARTISVAILILLAACSAPAPNRARVEAEVRDFLAHYTRTLEGDDEAAVRSLFVDDDRMAWFTDGALAYGSAADVLAGRQKYRGMRFSTTYTETEVRVLRADLASVRSGFRTELSGPGEWTGGYGGVITMLVERDSAGSWRVLQGHTSTPGAPPGGGEGR